MGNTDDRLTPEMEFLLSEAESLIEWLESDIGVWAGIDEVLVSLLETAKARARANAMLITLTGECRGVQPCD